MTPKELQGTLKIMNDMAAIELALASLYKTCGAAFPEDKDLWAAISGQEEVHARSIGDMAELVAKEPQDFEIGRVFNSIAIGHIRLIIDNINDQIRNKEVTRNNALIIARDIENSLLEANYCEFLKTSNVRFMTIIDTIEKETAIHKNLFAGKAERSKTRAN